MTDEEQDQVTDEEVVLEPPSRSGTSTKTKVVAGIMALLLVVTFASSLFGGTRDTSGTTTTTGPAADRTTSTTADRSALVDAGVALAAVLAPVPAGDVVVAGADVAAGGQNTPEASLVDIVAVGRYDADDGARYAFVQTRGGPPGDLTGCYQLAVTYAAASGTAAQGEINLGGPCAARGAFEKGRMAGFLLPRGALWILELDAVPDAGPAVAGIVATQLYLGDDTTLADTTALPLDAAPIAAEVAEPLLPLLNFRAAHPPDGPVATP